MAFDSRYMSMAEHEGGGLANRGNQLTQYGNGWSPRRWKYSTANSSSDVRAQDYFDPFRGVLRLGDKIDVTIFDDPVPALATTIVDTFTLIVTAVA